MKPDVLTPLEKGAVAVALPDGVRPPERSVIGQLSARFKLKSSPFFLLVKSSPFVQRLLILSGVMLLLSAFPQISCAQDLLAGQKTDINDTFGHGGTVEWILYIVEFLSCLWLYIKTRNPMVLGGLVLLIIATRTLYPLIAN